MFYHGCVSILWYASFSWPVVKAKAKHLTSGRLLLVNHCSCVCTEYISQHTCGVYGLCKQWCYGCFNAQVDYLINAGFFCLFVFRMNFGCLKILVSAGKSSMTWCAWWNGEAGPTTVFSTFCHVYGEQAVVLFFVPKCFLEKYFCSLRLGGTGKSSFSMVWRAVKTLGDMISVFCGFYLLKWQCAEFLLFWLYWVWFSFIWHLKSSLDLYR